jgi:hypothetical protein
MINCSLEGYHRRLARHKDPDRQLQGFPGLRLKARHLWNYITYIFSGCICHQHDEMMTSCKVLTNM